MLTGALRQLFAVAETYPDLKASTNFQQLQAELTDLENKIAAARRFFNNAVQEYNTGIYRFPAALFAIHFRLLRSKTFFDLGDERAAVGEAPPKVKSLYPNACSNFPDGCLWSLQPHPVKPAPLDSPAHRTVSLVDALVYAGARWRRRLSPMLDLNDADPAVSWGRSPSKAAPFATARHRRCGSSSPYLFHRKMIDAVTGGREIHPEPTTASRSISSSISASHAALPCPGLK